MAKYGVLMERDNYIANMITRAGVGTELIAGGSPVVEGAIQSGNDELYALSSFSTGDTRVGIAYNPTVPRDENGYPERSEDDRKYVNRIGDVVEYFYPEVEIEFGVQLANIVGETAPTVGKFLECTNGSFLFTIVDTQTVGVPSFEVVQIKSQTYPTGDFQSGEEPCYIVKTRFNG